MLPYWLEMYTLQLGWPATKSYRTSYPSHAPWLALDGMLENDTFTGSKGNARGYVTVCVGQNDIVYDVADFVGVIYQKNGWSFTPFKKQKQDDIRCF